MFHLDDNFLYKIKTDSLISLKDIKCIKLKNDNLYQLMLWHGLVNWKIVEKINKLNMNQMF